VGITDIPEIAWEISYFLHDIVPAAAADRTQEVGGSNPPSSIDRRGRKAPISRSVMGTSARDRGDTMAPRALLGESGRGGDTE